MIGSVIGNYKILAQIGEGGMGTVFKGIDLMIEREVAIKMLRPELARQPEVVERFRAEAVMLGKLYHPGIATLHNFLRQGDDFFMVMEFVPGETLAKVIQTFGAVPPDQAIRLCCSALEGLAHAHQFGIVHRDIKPANLMLTLNGGVKLMDFGIARVLNNLRKLTREGRMLGTIEYMSPEQIRGEEVDARSDVYSLGIVLYEMLTGRVPFTSSSEYAIIRAQVELPPPPPRELLPHLPPLLEQALLCALEKNPEARFQTAGAFHHALLECAAGTARIRTTPPQPVPTPMHRSQPDMRPTSAPLPERPNATPAAFSVPPPIKPTRFAAGPEAIPPPDFGTRQSAQFVSPMFQPSPATQSGLNLKYLVGAIAGAVVLGMVGIAVWLGGTQPVEDPSPRKAEKPASESAVAAPSAPVTGNTPAVAVPLDTRPQLEATTQDENQKPANNKGPSQPPRRKPKPKKPGKFDLPQ